VSHHQPTDTASPSGPKCPACGGGPLSFSEILGPVSHVQRVQAELSDLKKRFEAKASAATREPRTDEEAAFLHIADDPAEAARKLRQQQIEAVQREYATVRREAVARSAGPGCKVAVIHCVSCGHVVGTATLPEQQEAVAERLERGLAAIQETVAGLHGALVAALAGVQQQVAALNAREETREQAARVHAAVSVAGQLLSGRG
jgi:hypothetical protein